MIYHSGLEYKDRLNINMKAKRSLCIRPERYRGGGGWGGGGGGGGGGIVVGRGCNTRFCSGGMV